MPNVIVLLTDGIPTWEADLLPEEVRRIKSQGIRIVGVGVTNEVGDFTTSIYSRHVYRWRNFSTCKFKIGHGNF